MRPTFNRLVMVLFFADLLATQLALLVTPWLRVQLPFGLDLELAVAANPPGLALLAGICWSGSLWLLGSYAPGLVLRAGDEAGRVTMAALLATLLLAGCLFLSFREYSRYQFVYLVAVNLGLLLVYRAVLRAAYRLLGVAPAGAERRVLIVGAGRVGRLAAETVQRHSRWGYELLGFLDDDPAIDALTLDGDKRVPVLGTLAQLLAVVRAQNCDEVLIALPPQAYGKLEGVVHALRSEPVRIKIIPNYFSLALVQAQPEMLGGMPLIGLREPVIGSVARVVKRLFDIAVAALLLLALAPLLLVIGILVALSSAGPVVLRQSRMGENGRRFSMFKFRSMWQDANGAAAGPHKQREDPRVTPVGRVLRRFSLDELPQLVNVLRGDMTLVGPRPELPELVERYEPWQRKRFAVPQGMTGWWQVNGRSDKPMHLNSEDDLYYVYNYSFWLDLRILARTLLVVITGRGAF
jgi:exopolysaccharide biosynthesis polyprenyl glycosylphosphotransferase